MKPLRFESRSSPLLFLCVLSFWLGFYKFVILGWGLGMGLEALHYTGGVGVSGLFFWVWVWAWTSLNHGHWDQDSDMIRDLALGFGTLGLWVSSTGVMG